MIRVDVAYGLICEQNKVLMVNNQGDGWPLRGSAYRRHDNKSQSFPCDM